MDNSGGCIGASRCLPSAVPDANAVDTGEDALNDVPGAIHTVGGVET